MTSIKCGIILLLSFYYIESYGQTTADSFKIYYAPERYSDDLLKTLNSNKNFAPYKLMIQKYIDPKKTGGVNRDVFIKNIRILYPDSLSTGMLCIDLENKVFQNIIRDETNQQEFDSSVNIFLWMISTIKTLRPNLKVGIYGLPTRMRTRFISYDSNDPKKLDRILASCDYISPSLYTIYPDSQFGRQRNEKGLKENLQRAIEIGIRLNKPVIPFVWAVVHPANKLFSKKLLDKSEVVQNINFIKNFSYKNTTVKGIVWWDPGYISFSKMVNVPPSFKSSIPKQSQTQILRDYLNQFIK